MSDQKRKGKGLMPAVLCIIAGILTGCGDDLEAGSQMIQPNKLVSADAEADIQSQTDTGDPAGTKEQAGVDDAESTKEQTGIDTAENNEEQKGITEEIKEPEIVLETEPEDLPEVISLTISAAGDVTLGNYLGQGFESSFRQTYENLEDKSYFFQNVYDIFNEDDMTIVNLEGTLTFSENPAPDRTYNIKGDPEYAYLLNYGDIEAVSMANNHRMDFGDEGAADSVKAVKAADIAYAYDSVLGYYEVEGIRIGWVSVNEIAYGSGIEKFLEQGITQLKEEGVHLILACCHWGIERENYPTDYQREVGRKCIDWGADLVIGHHPHVLQGIEEYQGKYIVYSLGNFCFGANKNPADKDTMIFQQTFTFEPKLSSAASDSEGTEADAAVATVTAQEVSAAEGMSAAEESADSVYGHGIPKEARIIPCSVSSVTHRNDYCPTPLTGEEGQRVIGRVNEYSKEFGVSADADGTLQSAASS